MKISNPTVFVVIVFIWLLVVLGCGGRPSVSTHRYGCVTPDGSKIGAAKYDTVALIDGRTGEIIRKETGDSFGGAVCLENNRVLAVHSKAIIELTGDKRVERNEYSYTIIGVTEGGMVHYRGGKLKSSRSTFTEPLGVVYEKFGVVDNDIKPRELPYKTFRGLLQDQWAYWMIPVRLLNDGNLLVAAGSKPSSYSRSDGAEPELSPEPWGFYLVDPKTGDVRNFGETKKQDTETNFIYVPKVAATADGAYVAITNSVDVVNSVAVWANGGNKEIFKTRINNVFEIVDVIISDDGSKLVVKVRNPGQYEFQVYDVMEGTMINSFILDRYGIEDGELLDLANDKLILVDFDGNAAKVDVRTGEATWVTKFYDDPIN